MSQQQSVNVNRRWDRDAEAGVEEGQSGRTGAPAGLLGTGSHAERFNINHALGTVSRPEMKELLGEFRTLYQERLHRLEALTDGREETLGLKVQILQSYINDLSEQNDVLMQAMEELEREANRRVTTLEVDLQEYVAKVTECKAENNSLLATKENMDKQIADFFSFSTDVDLKIILKAVGENI